LHRVNGLEGSEHALGRCEFDEEIELIDSDMLRNVGQIRQHDRKGATLLNLKNVAEHLTKVFVIQDDENDWSSLNFIDHGKGAMSEFTRGVGLSVQVDNLGKLLAHVVGCEVTSALSKKEEVALCLERGGNVFVDLDVVSAKSLTRLQAEAGQVGDQLASSSLESLVGSGGLLVREPDGDEGHGEDCGDETFDVGVAEA